MLSPRMQLTIIAIAVAVVLIFIFGVFPLNYGFRRGLAVTVVLIAVCLFALATMIGDRIKRSPAADLR